MKKRILSIFLIFCTSLLFAEGQSDIIQKFLADLKTNQEKIKEIESDVVF